jgi:hypothetical protein
MIVAFIGCMDDESMLPISGIGKTCALTGYGLLNHLKGRTIYANYKTDFAIEQGFQTTIDTIIEEEENDIHHDNVDILITEMQKIIDAIGSDKKATLYIDNFAAQLRKSGANLFYDTQRFFSIQKRMRVHTDVILKPIKTHMDNSPCIINNCKADHKIFVYQLKPEPRKGHELKRVFIASKVGSHYDSRQYIIDKLNLPVVKK